MRLPSLRSRRHARPRAVRRGRRPFRHDAAAPDAGRASAAGDAARDRLHPGPDRGREGADGATPESVLEAVTSHRKWGDFPMSEDELLERWRGLDRIAPRARCVRAFYELYAEHQGKPRWGDKTPGYTMYMGRISRTLPEARFVHVIRDGRAVALSRMRTLALRPTEMSKVANRWQKRVRKARAKGADLDHYLEIRYEALVREPEATLREVCDFIDLAWDPAMLEYHRRSEERLAELDRDIPAWGNEAAALRRKPHGPSHADHQAARSGPHRPLA